MKAHGDGMELGDLQEGSDTFAPLYDLLVEPSSVPSRGCPASRGLPLPGLHLANTRP